MSEIFQEVAARPTYSRRRGLLSLTVIKPGLNKGRQRAYPPEVLRRDAKVFENARMHLDHPSDAEERARPVGSVQTWVASIQSVGVEEDGSVKAVAAVIDPAFKEKLATMQEAGILKQMGISIRCTGTAKRGKYDGVDTNVVESLDRCMSVDFVTAAGAGGAAEFLESEQLIADVNDTLRNAGESQLTEAERQRMNDMLLKLDWDSLSAR